MRQKAQIERWRRIRRPKDSTMILNRLNHFFWFKERGIIDMKIQNASGSIVPIDLRKMKGTEKVASSDAKKTVEATRSNRSVAIDTKVSQTLHDTLNMISEAGLTAGAVHSNVDESRVAGLLKSMDVEAKRPNLDAEALMKLADKVSEDIQNNPEQAADAFNPLDPSRIADLL